MGSLLTTRSIAASLALGALDIAALLLREDAARATVYYLALGAGHASDDRAWRNFSVLGDRVREGAAEGESHKGKVLEENHGWE